MSQVEILETPIKSEGDKKDYRLIKLSNGLKAILIRKNEENGGQSNTENFAAAQLTVKVGTSNDPPTAMGLAHFLEHILFMGSEKYPGENSFNDFITANGGADNAMTSFEATTFFFKVGEKSFDEALDIFAQQFISPLLLKDTMQREREAVDSEYQMAKSNDYVLAESLLKAYIKESHPASQFDCGNLKTLKDDITDDDLHSELLKLHAKYVGNKMFLAIQSKKTLDEMQELVVQCFSSVKKGDEETTETEKNAPNFDQILKPEFFSKVVFMKPITARQRLSLTWALPPFQKHYKSAPLEYISKIFDNDGEGGVASYLKDKQLITMLSFYTQKSSYAGNDEFCMPKLTIVLTDLGAGNIDKILESIFSYLLMIKETPMEEHLRFYNEIKENQELEFKYHSESSALSNVRNLITPMTLYDDVDILRGTEIFQKFDEKLTSEVIELLNQRKFNIFITNNERESYSKKEKYFEVEYDEEDFPESYQKLWDERKSNPDFFLEKPSPLKATNFEIFEIPEESPVRFFYLS